MNPLRIVFLGSDPIALPALDWIAGPGAGTARIVAVFTQPDRPAGRGQATRPNAIKAWAAAHGLPVHQPEKMTDAETAGLAAIGADASLVVAYGHLLRESFLAGPRLGTFNLHASLLPKYRGASPIQTAIACGERTTGMTFMRLVRRLDAGPVADMERIPVGALDTPSEVEPRLAAACIPLLGRVLPGLAAGALEFTEQDEPSASFCRKLDKEDGVLDFNDTAGALAARINGLYPWPGCGTVIEGERIRLGLADTGAGPAGKPGEVVGQDSQGLLVATGSGTLRLRRLQREGRKMMAAVEFLRGFPVPRGTAIPSQPMRPLLAGC